MSQSTAGGGFSRSPFPRASPAPLEHQSQGPGGQLGAADAHHRSEPQPAPSHTAWDGRPTAGNGSSYQLSMIHSPQHLLLQPLEALSHCWQQSGLCVAVHPVGQPSSGHSEPRAPRLTGSMVPALLLPDLPAALSEHPQHSTVLSRASAMLCDCSLQLSACKPPDTPQG